MELKEQSFRIRGLENGNPLYRALHSQCLNPECSHSYKSRAHPVGVFTVERPRCHNGSIKPSQNVYAVLCKRLGRV